MRTLVLTCPELDQGHRMQVFPATRFPNLEFVEGVSPESLIDSEGIADNGLEYGFGPRSWDAGAMSIAYGHCMIWKLVAEHSEPCLVLEDDITALPASAFDYTDLWTILDIFQLPGKWVLSLWPQGIHDSEPFRSGCFRVIPSFSNSGALAYILPPRTASFLVENFPDISCPVDHYLLGMGLPDTKDFQAFVTDRNLVGHGSFASLRELA